MAQTAKRYPQELALISIDLAKECLRLVEHGLLDGATMNRAVTKALTRAFDLGNEAAPASGEPAAGAP